MALDVALAGASRGLAVLRFVTMRWRCRGRVAPRILPILPALVAECKSDVAANVANAAAVYQLTPRPPHLRGPPRRNSFLRHSLSKHVECHRGRPRGLNRRRHVKGVAKAPGAERAEAIAFGASWCPPNSSPACAQHAARGFVKALAALSVLLIAPLDGQRILKRRRNRVSIHIVANRPHVRTPNRRNQVAMASELVLALVLSACLSLLVGGAVYECCVFRVRRRRRRRANTAAQEPDLAPPPGRPAEEELRVAAQV